MNISEYIFYIFELLSNQEKKEKYSNEKEINITIDTYNYDITLFLDNTQRYIELIKLYNCGFDKDCDFVTVKKQNQKNNNKYVKNKINSFEGVVFAGGGNKVCCLSGMYEYLCKNYKNDIKTLIGTSAGSMLACLLAMNHDSDCIYKFLIEFKLSDNIKKSLKNISITDTIQKKGILNNNIILNYLENVFTKYNDGIIPTLLDIKNKYDKELVCVTYNITKNKLEYLNYKNSPDLLVTYACVMSSCIPIVFNPFEYKNNLYLDGCVLSNFPVEYTSEYKNINFACFGFNNKVYSLFDNILEHLMKIFYEKANINENEKMDSNIENCEYFIYTGNNKYNPLIVNEKELLDMYNNGYKCMMEKNTVK
jgi:predicted acylesterase/phospholipase RssA